MKGFENHQWRIFKYSSSVEITHKKFPFIKIRGDKKSYKTDAYQSRAQTHWSFFIPGWTLNSHFNFTFTGKLLQSNTAEIFEELIKYKDCCHAILDYLFNGNWK